MFGNLESKSEVLVGIAEPITAQRLSVIGTYSAKRPFVCHASLLKNETKFAGECVVTALHVGPPIESREQLPCHIIGKIATTVEEVEALEDWLAGIETQYVGTEVLPFQQFTIVPHMKWVGSEINRPFRQRFSCVGYVIEAYRAAEIDLIDTNQVPDATLAEVKDAYPELQRIEQSPPLRKKYGFISWDDLGVAGDGPWKVILPGYVFHAINAANGIGRFLLPFAPSDVSMANFPLN